MSQTPKPDVSFLIQNKNYGRYLSQCLKSILNQSPDFTYQIIGLDAGSTDDSREVYKKILGGYVDVTGCNQAEALNIGLKQAEGKYIGWINSDDFYLPNYVETHISLFEKFKHQNVVLTFAEHQPQIEWKGLSYRIMRLKYLGIYLMNNANRGKWLVDKIRKNNYNPIKLVSKTLHLSSRIWRDISTATFRPRKTFLGNSKLNINNFREECVHNPAAMFKKDAVIQIDGWNENLTFCIDDDLFLRLAQIGNLAYTPNFTAVCRIHERNMSTKKMWAQENEVKNFYEHYKNARLGEIYIESCLPSESTSD